MDAFSCLTSSSNSPLIHSQYGPPSAGSLIIYFPLRKHSPVLSLSSVLLKCNGKQHPLCLLQSECAEKKEYNNFGDLCNWCLLRGENTLRGLGDFPQINHHCRSIHLADARCDRQASKHSHSRLLYSKNLWPPAHSMECAIPAQGVWVKFVWGFRYCTVLCLQRILIFLCGRKNTKCGVLF